MKGYIGLTYSWLMSMCMSMSECVGQLWMYRLDLGLRVCMIARTDMLMSTQNNWKRCNGWYQCRHLRVGICGQVNVCAYCWRYVMFHRPCDVSQSMVRTLGVDCLIQCTFFFYYKRCLFTINLINCIQFISLRVVSFNKMKTYKYSTRLR